MGGRCLEHKPNDKNYCEYCGQKLVIILKDHYEYLQKRDELLDFLEALSVDNWSGYRTPPDPDDYDTDEEYEKAYENALNAIW